MIKPAILKCFKCEHPVFEFEEDRFGCDNCKSVWMFDGKGWINIKDLEKIKIMNRNEHNKRN